MALPAGSRGDMLARALSLIERVHRAGEPMSGEYPLVFEDAGPGRLVAVEEEGDVRSACAVLVRDFVVEGLVLRGGMIGSVSTDPEFRGRGLASRVLREAEAQLVRDGCAFSLLWADDPEFYTGRGYRPIGSEVDFLLPVDERHRLPCQSRLRAAAPDDYGALHRLYTLQRSRVERSAAETARLLSGPGIETLALVHQRDVVAYTCLGRGADFARTVHEWSGAPLEVLALVREHLRRAHERGESEPVALMTPPGAAEMHELLEARGFPAVRGILGLAKLLDAEAATHCLAQAGGPRLRISIMARAGRGDDVTIAAEGPGGRVELPPVSVLELLFPARGDRSALEQLEAAIGLELPALPLPLYAWGLDSI